MRISELSARSGVPVATVKFYLREGLVPEGELTSATQAQYGEVHLQRIRLIRALTGPSGLALSKVKHVLVTLDGPPPPWPELFAAAPGTPAADPPHDLTEVDGLLALLGWVDVGETGLRDRLASALDAIREAGRTLSEASLVSYARHLEAIAQLEVDAVPVEDPSAALRYVVLDTVLVEPVLLALRRLARAHLATRRFGATGSAPTRSESGDQ